VPRIVRRRRRFFCPIDDEEEEVEESKGAVLSRGRGIGAVASRETAVCGEHVGEAANVGVVQSREGREQAESLLGG
jgi:hypothetical protein